jgi:hypothetical protein
MYAKIFSSLFDGSMRGHPDLILVFVNLLCHSDEDGIVDRHWRAISDETGLSEDKVRQAISELESADPESRTPTEQGRRIVRIDEHRDWGWRIVNHKHYRDIRTQAERREYMRKYMADKRKQTCKQNVSTCKQNVSTLANTDTETSTHVDTESIPVDTGGIEKPKKETWLTPYEAIHEKHCGVVLNHGEWAKVLSELLKRTTKEVILRHLENYYSYPNNKKMQSITHFANTFKAYEKPCSRREW